MRINDLYIVGDWDGHPNYLCRACAYASLDEPTTRRHAATHLHPGDPSGLLDLSGTPIVTEPVAGPSTEFTRGHHPDPGVFAEPAEQPDSGDLLASEPRPFSTFPTFTED